MSGTPSTYFHASLLERKISTRLGGTAMSNTDEERQEPTGTYANRGIPLPGLRPAHQRLGLTQRELAARAGTGQQTICKLETLQRGSYPQTLQKLAVALSVTSAELVEVALTSRSRPQRDSSKIPGLVYVPHISRRRTRSRR